MGQDIQKIKDDFVKSQKVRVGIFLPAWQKQALEEIAEQEGRTVSDLIRQQTSTFLRERNNEYRRAGQ